MSLLSATQMLGPTLVLRRFDVSRTPTDGVFVDIAGRPAGLLGWILTVTGGVTGLATEQSLRVTATEIVQHSGTGRDLVPISHVASASTGYSKSTWMLWLGLLLLAYGLYKGFGADSKIVLGLGLIFGGGLLAGYWFSRRLKIVVETVGGRMIGLNFKRSVIEGVAVDLEKCATVVDVLQHLILASQARRDVRADVLGSIPQGFEASAKSAPVPEAPAPRTSNPSLQRPMAATPARCGKCGTLLEPAGKFCENCGARVDVQ